MQGSSKLFIQAITKFLAGLLLVSILVFLPAGTLAYWQAWLLIGILFIPMFIAGLVMMKKSPDLLRKRLNAKEEQDEQKTVILLSGLMFLAAFVLAGLNFRFGWIVLPGWVSYAAAAVFLAAYALYAEVLRLDLVEMLQRDYRVTIAGPTTMAAILNSFQLGFRSLALQQSSGEVWETLEKVRTEFGKFNDVLEDTQHRLDQAQKDLEQLVGARTRSIQRSLDKVSDYTDYKDNTHGQ